MGSGSLAVAVGGEEGVSGTAKLMTSSAAASGSEGRLRRGSFKLRSRSLDTLRLRRVFDLFDKNGDGVLTVEEMGQAVQLLGLEADPNEIRSIITSFIRPGYAGLAFDHFQALHQSLNQAFFDCDCPEDDSTDAFQFQEQQGEEEEISRMTMMTLESDLREAFKVFDEDGDGYICAKELQAVLSKLGLPQAHHDLTAFQLMISSVDHNHDGLVDFSEFKHMMLHSLPLP